MSSLSKLLVIGAGGMVGNYINFGIKQSHADLDITDEQSLKHACDKIKPSGILCLSSVNLRDCEKDPLKAYAVNVLGVHTAVNACLERNIPLVYISSGAIFNGPVGTSFNEDTTPSPVNIYGQSKYIAELLIQTSGVEHIIARTGWLFGLPLAQEKTGMFDKMLRKALNREEIRATKDSAGSPTYIKDFVDTLKTLIEENKRGMYNIANQGGASAAAFMQEANKLLNGRATIKEVYQKDLETNGPKRSPSEVITSTKLDLRPWPKALAEYLTTLK